MRGAWRISMATSSGAKNFFLEVRTITWSRTNGSRRHWCRLSSETGFPLVATNDSHYLRKDDARAHEILICIQTGKALTRSQPYALEHAGFLPEDRATK